MTSSLVGSEMCIRDRLRRPERWATRRWPTLPTLPPGWQLRLTRACLIELCLLYTSDAADDM
eukprot:2294984-Prorocentrum_lima.AAC.1